PFMTLRRAHYLVFLSLISAIAYAQEPCKYFNLPLPNASPQDFNPEVIDFDGRFKFNVEMTQCNEIYFTAIDGSENIYFSRKRNSSWSKPTIASFSDPNFNDADPYLSRDGERIYFISKRPTHNNDKNLDFNIWYADRTNDSWSAPHPLPEPINSDTHDEYFFSISNKGNVFFSSNRSGGEGSFDIYTAKVQDDGSFADLQNIGRPVSTEKYEFDPYISPDERFLIYSINYRGNSSLYISYKNDQNKWTTPINLGPQINTTNQDFAPSLSADGNYLFYSNNGKLKWINMTFLNGLN
ncbi:MAG: sialidase family protein, partial [Bacteroidota bacterium]